MDEEKDFFVYLLECYAEYKGKSSQSILKIWDEKNITEEIYSGFWGYHTEAMENAFKDIDSLIDKGEHLKE
ncbi:MAG: DUF3791 domain-containing protein [Firmicutes bacterium]|nr:DUF3791 domain-containing protein [Bacillota bacterium]